MQRWVKSGFQWRVANLVQKTSMYRLCHLRPVWDESCQAPPTRAGRSRLPRFAFPSLPGFPQVPICQPTWKGGWTAEGAADQLPGLGMNPGLWIGSSECKILHHRGEQMSPWLYYTDMDCMGEMKAKIIRTLGVCKRPVGLYKAAGHILYLANSCRPQEK